MQRAPASSPAPRPLPLAGASRHVPVVVLGAGLTGLAAALELERAGVDYHVFEKNDHVGGHATTVEDNGYRFDRTGHLLHLRSSALRAEVLSWLEGDCLEIERRSVVFSHGVYTRYPFQANTAGLPPAVQYECLLGFIRAHFAAPSAPPRNFEEYCLTHFGAGFARHFLLPYNTKLWGVAASEITAEWCQRFVPLPALEDVLAGALGLPDPKLGYNARFLYPTRGIGALPEALARRVSKLTLGARPSRIHADARQLELSGERISYDVLISSAPLPTLLGSLGQLPEAVQLAAQRLNATNLYYLDLALTVPAKRGFHWAYVPEERFPFYRVGCYSNFSASLAPPGCSSLYVELSQRSEPDLTELLSRVLNGLSEMGVLGSERELKFARLRQLAPAYVVYDHAHAAALRTIVPFLEGQRVLSTGRYGAWNYSSMEDALCFGREAAQRAMALLGHDERT